MSGGKVAVSSVSFTLPLSCQICLGKVREPVTCSNQHVFCSDCMNVWLERNSCCPTCRVQISPQSPVKRIIGGVIENSSSSLVSRGTSRELRRTRYELILKEYEDDIQQLEIGMERLERENKSLKSELRMLKQVKVETVNEYFNTNTSCQRCSNIKDVDTMLDMTKKLQEATKTYSKTKKEMIEVKKINEILRKNNDDLKRENQRVREEVSTRSPMKFGRLTVAALESRLESSEKQVAQLMKALQKNDEHTDQLEAELAELKQQPMKENYNGDKLQNPILASILNEPQTNCENLPERGRTVATPSSKLKNLTLVTPEHKNYSEPSFCSRDDQATVGRDGVETMLSFPSDLKSTISRKLTFETKEVTEENKAPQTECKNADLLT
uniref:RING-type domain-containing protein n=1 Tax=Ciona savignyi TaxID=51511 RepID=H2Z800_CIOSA